MTTNKGAKAAEAFSDFLNSSTSTDREAFALAVTGDHRFLQQQSFLLFERMVELWAGAHKTGNYDERNKYTVTTSATWLEAKEQS